MIFISANNSTLELMKIQAYGSKALQHTKNLLGTALVFRLKNPIIRTKCRLKRWYSIANKNVAKCLTLGRCAILPDFRQLYLYIHSFNTRVRPCESLPFIHYRKTHVQKSCVVRFANRFCSKETPKYKHCEIPYLLNFL